MIVIALIGMLVLVVGGEFAYLYFLKSETKQSEESQVVSTLTPRPIPAGRNFSFYREKLEGKLDILDPESDKSPLAGFVKEANFVTVVSGVVEFTGPTESTTSDSGVGYKIVLTNSQGETLSGTFTPTELANATLVGINDIHQLKKGDFIEIRAETNLLDSSSDDRLTLNVRP